MYQIHYFARRQIKPHKNNIVLKLLSTESVLGDSITKNTIFVWSARRARGARRARRAGGPAGRWARGAPAVAGGGGRIYTANVQGRALSRAAPPSCRGAAGAAVAAAPAPKQITRYCTYFVNIEIYRTIYHWAWIIFFKLRNVKVNHTCQSRMTSCSGGAAAGALPGAAPPAPTAPPTPAAPRMARHGARAPRRSSPLLSVRRPAL